MAVSLLSTGQRRPKQGPKRLAAESRPVFGLLELNVFLWEALQRVSDSKRKNVLLNSDSIRGEERKEGCVLPLALLRPHGRWRWTIPDAAPRRR